MFPIQTILSYFSFTHQEAEIYLASLTLGRASLTELAKKVDKQRSAVYFHIKNLVKKGFLFEHKQGNKLLFSPISPSELSNEFSRRVETFQTHVPNLEALKQIETDTPAITVLESKTGYLKIYEEIAALPPKSMFRVLEGRTALAHELTLFSKEQWGTFFSTIVDKKIETKGLFTHACRRIPQMTFDKETHQKLTKRIWHMRFIDETVFPFEDLIMIYGNTIAFMFPQSRLTVKIVHRDIARLMTLLFDTVYLTGVPDNTPW